MLYGYCWARSGSVHRPVPSHRRWASRPARPVGPWSIRADRAVLGALAGWAVPALPRCGVCRSRNTSMANAAARPCRYSWRSTEPRGRRAQVRAAGAYAVEGSAASAGRPPPACYRGAGAWEGRREPSPSVSQRAVHSSREWMRTGRRPFCVLPSSARVLAGSEGCRDGGRAATASRRCYGISSDCSGQRLHSVEIAIGLRPASGQATKSATAYEPALFARAVACSRRVPCTALRAKDKISVLRSWPRVWLMPVPLIAEYVGRPPVEVSPAVRDARRRARPSPCRTARDGHGDRRSRLARASPDSAPAVGSVPL